MKHSKNISYKDYKDSFSRDYKDLITKDEQIKQLQITNELLLLIILFFGFIYIIYLLTN